MLRVERCGCREAHRDIAYIERNSGASRSGNLLHDRRVVHFSLLERALKTNTDKMNYQFDWKNDTQASTPLYPRLESSMADARASQVEFLAVQFFESHKGEGFGVRSRVVARFVCLADKSRPASLCSSVW